MKYKIVFPKTEKDFKYMAKVTKETFGVVEDGVEPTVKNAKRIMSLEKNNFICCKDRDKPIAWSLVLPTSKKEAKHFLEGKITENELFNQALEKPSFESLYLFMVIVMPEYRRQRISFELVKNQIEYFKDKYKIDDFYAWTLSVEGKNLTESLKKEIEPRIRYISL